MSQDQREKFEAWLWDVHHLNATWNTGRNCYDEFPAHLAFKAWQQAIQALSAEPLTEQRKELVAAWNDLPDSIRCHPGLKRLFRACQVS